MSAGGHSMTKPHGGILIHKLKLLQSVKRTICMYAPAAIGRAEQRRLT